MSDSLLDDVYDRVCDGFSHDILCERDTWTQQ
jgi:hypothetical protein